MGEDILIDTADFDRPVQLLRSAKASTMSSPIPERRPITELPKGFGVGDATRLSSWPKFLIVIAIAATPTCYFFIFGDSDRSVDVAIAPQATSVKFLPL